MCNAKPGTRCSPHAKEALITAEKNYKDALKSVGASDYANVAEIFRPIVNPSVKALKAAWKDYDATVEGKKELRKLIKEQPSNVEALKSRLASAEVYTQQHKLAVIMKEDAYARAAELFKETADEDLALVTSIVNRGEGSIEERLANFAESAKETFSEWKKELTKAINYIDEVAGSRGSPVSTSEEAFIREARLNSLRAERMWYIADGILIDYRKKIPANAKLFSF